MFDKNKKEEKPKKIRIGIWGVIMLLLSLIIIGGIGTTLYLFWTFKSVSNTKAATDEGLIPVIDDFAPNQPKASDVLFRIAGKNRIGEKLFPDLISAWLKSRGFGNVSASTENQIITIHGTKDGKTYRVLVALGSAKGGFEAMTQNRVEGVISLRPIEPSEADKLSAMGDMTSVNNEKIVAHDVSFVFVHPSSSISSLNGETLGKILSGEINNWSEISDKMEGEIAVKIEDEGGDKSKSLLAKLLGDSELIEKAKAFETPAEVIDAVSRDVNAIGFAHRDNSFNGVKTIAMNERNARIFEPNAFNIAVEAYPFTERAYFYINTTNKDNQINDFSDYVLSPNAQEIIRRAGFNGQQLQPYSIPTPDNAPKDYKSFANNAKRMNFDIRFQFGANNLDNKALVDIKRLEAFMQQQGINQKQVALFGFADNVGAKQTNIGLAQSRAEKALAQLSEIGINPSVVRSYGDAMPVGANINETGRIKNRRVEVWICPPPSCPLVNIVDPNQNLQQETTQSGTPSGVHIGKPSIQEGEDTPKG